MAGVQVSKPVLVAKITRLLTVRAKRVAKRSVIAARRLGRSLPRDVGVGAVNRSVRVGVFRVNGLGLIAIGSGVLRDVHVPVAVIGLAGRNRSRGGQGGKACDEGGDGAHFNLIGEIKIMQ